jgi:hypothetical protein
MNSAIRRSRRAFVSSLLISSFFVAHPVHAQEAAGPTKINVTVQPANGTAQKATCGDTYKCTLSATVQTAAGQAETVTVNVYHVPGNTLFSFQTPEGFLYVGDKPQADPEHPTYRVQWGGLAETTTQSVANITLYEPFVANDAAAPWLTAPGKAFADLQVAVQAAP